MALAALSAKSFAGPRPRIHFRTLNELGAMAPRAENATGVKSMDDSGALAAASCLDRGNVGCRNR